jgi:hypothetical protein
LSCPKCKRDSYERKYSLLSAAVINRLWFQSTFDVVRAKLKDQKTNQRMVHAILKEGY